MELILHVAGRMQSNPGLSAAGVVICRDDGAVLYEAGFFLGNQTAESAQYHGLLRGLERLAALNPARLSIFVPEDFLIQHVTGQLLVANPSLEMLHEQAQLKLLRLGRWSIRRTPEGEGRRAVDLAAAALQSQATHIVDEPQQPSAAAESPLNSAESADSRTADETVRGAIEFSPSEPGSARIRTGERQVHVQLSSRPREECPAGDWCPDVLTIGSQLPAAICIHAAHAITPTILAMLNSDADDFALIPTLTVRCTRKGCPATFHLSPAGGQDA